MHVWVRSWQSLVDLVSVTGVTAASSGTHTRWRRKQASSLALSSAPVAADRASSLAPWRARQRDVSIPEGGRGDAGRGLRDGIVVLLLM